MAKDEIIAEIIKHFGLNVFSNFSGYYVGITNDINRRLFWNIMYQKEMTIGYGVKQRAKKLLRKLSNISLIRHGWRYWWWH